VTCKLQKGGKRKRARSRKTVGCGVLLAVAASNQQEREGVLEGKKENDIIRVKTRRNSGIVTKRR